VALLIPATTAFAVPSKADKVAQARIVKSQIDSLDHKVDIATENYLDAQILHGQALVQTRKAAQRVAKAEKRIKQLQTHLRTRASGMYRSGPLGFVDVLFGSKSFEQFARTWDVLKQLNAEDAAAVVEMKAAREEATAAHVQLAAKERVAAKQVKIMSSNKASIVAQLAKRKNALAGLQSEIAALQAAEEARQAVEARAWAASAQQSSSGGGGDSRQYPAPTRAPRGEVVSIARKYLGAPYVWGADGPNTFDCSGFTMFVYRQVGVSLPHSSRAQIGSGERVSRGDLQPGDLVFFGSPIHHVGMYVGGGMYIHAPHTGDVVKISPLSRGDYAGACRP